MSEQKVVQIRELDTNKIAWHSGPMTHPSSIERMMQGALRNLGKGFVVEVVDYVPPEPKK